jgi:hypothetical protein
MAKNHIQLLCLVAVTIHSLADAEINSGGGKSLDGVIYNQSSIGDPFATLTTESHLTSNHHGLIEVIYPITPSSISDVNGNGLPDGWEVQYFGALGADPAADGDNDGTSNLLEYLAGTNPNSPSSVFRPQGTYISGVFKLPIPCVSGRNYQIWVSRDLQSWTLKSTLTGNNLEQIFEFDETTITSGSLHCPIHPSNYFFRIQILIP